MKSQPGEAKTKADEADVKGDAGSAKGRGGGAKSRAGKGMLGNGMLVETVAIDSVSADPANVRKHGPKNLGAILGSLKRFGQQKPIVVDAQGIVRAGNGTLEAARTLGWKTIAVVKTGLSAAEATAYAIADNRTGDLAEWDDEALMQQLDALRQDGLDLEEIGFDEHDLEELRGDAETDEAEGGGGTSAAIGNEKYMVVITCRDEAHQTELLDRFDKEKLECRALTT